MGLASSLGESREIMLVPDYDIQVNLCVRSVIAFAHIGLSLSLYFVVALGIHTNALTGRLPTELGHWSLLSMYGIV